MTSPLDIYRRATQGGSDDYLTVNQRSEPERVEKILAAAAERRAAKNARRAKLMLGKPFQLDMRKHADRSD